MKFALVALVLAVCLVGSTEAFWGYGGLYGGYGLGLGGLGWGGLGWGGLGWGGYGLWGKRSTTDMPESLTRDAKMTREETEMHSKRSWTNDENNINMKRNSWTRDEEMTMSRNAHMERSLETEKREVDLIASTLNRTECAYIKETSMLSCHGVTGIVECEAVLNWEKPLLFKVFAIAKSEEPIGDIKYRILPRKLDNSGWESDIFMYEGVQRYISLWYSEKIQDFGLRVKDLQCFNKMVDLFAHSLRSETVFLSSELSVKQTAVIIGDLMVADKLPEVKDLKEKRWWGYGGLYGGYYGGLYGLYGGYGWGGYGYYGKRDSMPLVEAKITRDTY